MNPFEHDYIALLSVSARTQTAVTYETLDRILAAKPVKPQPESARRLRGAARWGV